MAYVEGDDEFYEIPLTEQKVFGAGIRRKRIRFISPKKDDTPRPGSSTTASGASAAERYLAVVFPKNIDPEASTDPPAQEISTTTNRQPPRPPTCDICKLPIDATCAAVPHEASLAHQVCLPHSHPPSSLDRNRIGLQILQAYGWDPDNRNGLGAPGSEGMLYPLKPKEKRDTAGLAARDTSDDEDLKKKKKSADKVERLNAKQVRKREIQNRRRHERLAEMFYRNDEMEKYLRPG
ncbi:hypothetical protein EV356DRAFT_528735 [Viridothelium virens]|uniref:G-patch domain-containing protein n=1 Tax=Viridothelium virens TaxID=1048519 RepID=A0A6A6HM13_VIRVR|nr:hypothetical protein EV356DRAFT_528735 [Viridothelium virens]